MTIKHIQDQIQEYGHEVAKEAYRLGLNHAQQLYSKDVPLPETDDLLDALEDIAKNKLKGEK